MTVAFRENSNGSVTVTEHNLTRNEIDAKLGVAWERKFQEYRNGG